MNTLVLAADDLRRRVYRVGARTALGRLCVRDRSARLAILAAAHMVVALVLAVVAPLWLLLLGPILLGVPHVVADVRYLLIRPAAGLGRGLVGAILVPLTLMTGLRTIVLAGGPHLPAVEVALGIATVAAAVVLPAGSTWRRLGLLALVAPGALLALAHPGQVALWLGHLHNFVAFALWLALYGGEGPRWRSLAVGGVFLGAVALLASGALEPIARAVGAYEASSTGLDMTALARTMAPGLDPTVGLRLVVVFVFAQSVHYVVWLRLIPQRCDRRPNPTSLRTSLARLRAELGPIGFRAAVVLTLAVPVLALFDAAGTRLAYLTLVLFHGWLEIAFAAVLLLSGRQVLE